MTSRIRELAATTPEMAAVFDDAATLAGALRFEAALARACVEEGLIPSQAAAAIEAACREPMDLEMLAREAAHAGTLAIPFVSLLRERVAVEAAPYVHLGSTSQDLADSVLMMQAKGAYALIEGELARVLPALARLAEAYSETPTIGRTLMQPARPISFGLKAANWLLGVDAAAQRLAREAAVAIRLQFGGAAGARHDLSGQGEAVAARLGEALCLETGLPWHARREGLAGLAAALAILIGTVAKIARDISLLAQAEVAEAFEPTVKGRGGSSAMPHKRNATGCQAALSAAYRAPQLAATITGALPQEHERGLGGWQIEAAIIAELFQLAHGALVSMRDVLEGLDVDAARMAASLGRQTERADIGESARMVAAALSAWRKQDVGNG